MPKKNRGRTFFLLIIGLISIFVLLFGSAYFIDCVRTNTVLSLNCVIYALMSIIGILGIAYIFTEMS
jgi:hypothetical protein